MSRSDSCSHRDSVSLTLQSSPTDDSGAIHGGEQEWPQTQKGARVNMHMQLGRNGTNKHSHYPRCNRFRGPGYETCKTNVTLVTSAPMAHTYEPFLTGTAVRPAGSVPGAVVWANRHGARQPSDAGVALANALQHELYHRAENELSCNEPLFPLAQVVNYNTASQVSCTESCTQPMRRKAVQETAPAHRSTYLTFGASRQFLESESSMGACNRCDEIPNRR